MGTTVGRRKVAALLPRTRQAVPVVVADGLARDKLVAYVLNMTQKWQPDWGGALQFFDRDDHGRSVPWSSPAPMCREDSLSRGTNAARKSPPRASVKGLRIRHVGV